MDSHAHVGMRVCGMRTGITVDVSAADRARVEAIVADRNSPQKHVWRARIVLLTAAAVGTNAPVWGLSGISSAAERLNIDQAIALVKRSPKRTAN